MSTPDSTGCSITAETPTLDQWVADLIATAPPATPEQIDRLRQLLPPVRNGTEAAA